MLAAIEQGDRKAAEDLLPLVYTELRRLAAWQMAKELPGQTLQPTALVHEAWLRLIGSGGAQWENSRHFFGAAAEAMRRILVDNARRKHAVRHGGGLRRTQLNELTLAATTPGEQLLAMDEALEALSRHDPTVSELVKLRYFAGFTLEQAGRILGLSPRTAKRHWAYARAWLYRRIAGGQDAHRPLLD
jgi:RNA polymerase sigma factor (TIGR02999 family)